MNIYTARWNNAKKIAEKIIKIQSEGGLVFNEENSIVNKFVIDKDRTGIEGVYELGNNITVFYFQNTLDWDHGMYTPIKEYNKQFVGWKFVHPKHVNTLL
mgnify:FL=1